MDPSSNLSLLIFLIKYIPSQYYISTVWTMGNLVYKTYNFVKTKPDPVPSIITIREEEDFVVLDKI